MDTDTGKITQLLAGLNGNAMHERNFEISPNGQFISVATSGHIDIYYWSMYESDIAYQNAIMYQRTISAEFLPLQYWLPDSSGLTAVIATDKYNGPGTAPAMYAALSYSLGGVATQIPLGATIMQNSGCNFSISPDRKWIYFIGNETGDQTVMPTLFFGNLKDGLTQSINWEFNVDCPSEYYQKRWSPDSKYYAFEKSLVGIDGTVIPIDGFFSGWIDPIHYFYVEEGQKPWQTRIGEIGGESIPVPEDFKWLSTSVVMPPTAEL